MNVCIPELVLPLVLELALELDELDGLRSDQGTATCLLPELMLPDGFALLLKPEELEEVPELLPELVPVADVSDVPPLAPPVTETIANSTLPEVGLINTSLIVPRFSPDEELIVALVNSLALIGCCPMRPVALKRLELPRLLPDEDELPSELPGLLCDEPEDPRLLSEELPELEVPDEPLELLSDEPCACAAVTKQAAHKATAAVNCFFITCLSLLFLYLQGKSDTTQRRLIETSGIRLNPGDSATIRLTTESRGRVFFYDGGRA